MKDQGVAHGTRALLMGICRALNRESIDLHEAGEDARAARLVYLIVDVLEAMDDL